MKSTLPQATAPDREKRTGSRAPAGKTPRSRKLLDRLAAASVVAGGASVIAAIFGILVFILHEVTPLFFGAEVQVRHAAPISEDAPEAVLLNEYLDSVAALDRNGRLRILRARDGKMLRETTLFEALEGESAGSEAMRRNTTLEAVRAFPEASILAGTTAGGEVACVRVEWEVTYSEDGERKVEGSFGEAFLIEMDPLRRPPRAFTLARSGDSESDRITVAGQLEDGRIAWITRERETNLLTEEASISIESSFQPSRSRYIDFVLDEEARNLYAAARDGEVAWWKLSASALEEPSFSADRGPDVTAVALLAGGRSLVLGRADGSASIWFQIRDEDDSIRLASVRQLPGPGVPARRIVPSPRDRSFFTLYEGGELRLLHSTSERLLWTGSSPVAEPAAICYAPKGDGLAVAGEATLWTLAVDNPHPDVSWKSLFGKVWFEGSSGPDHVWQSDGGSAHFEPKTVLMLLVFGTLKGTFYSLILAIPLGVLGALYTSQFLSPSLQRTIKPAVEIMAALPTVILGFLAGLWLAPLIEEYFPAILLMLAVFPAVLIGAGALWERLPRGLRGRLPEGVEVLVFAVVLALAMYACLWLNGAIEHVAFGGDFPGWLYETFGWRYDQRNAIVVGIAMGFAVIPIVFSISEEAFSSVPRTLVSGSLALGATRWQTVSRIVLPTASPGVFAAVMIGFGRAVGETMIVLMATGNTPIWDWSPFNGFRTLSANIAVEIPEAPRDGSLYRILFLSALLLFVITFIVNTAAELVRHRLRKRFGQL